VVEYLIDNLAGLPILLLVSLRLDDGPAVDLARRARQRRAAIIMELGRLSPPQVRQLAACCLDVAPEDLPPAMVDRLLRDGDGNPLVIEELLRGALAVGALVRDAEGCRMANALGERVPTTLVRIVEQRADRLGPQGRELLNVAAVLGRRFNVSAVQEISRLDDRSLLSHLSAAVSIQLIEPDPTAPDWYNFRHALTAEALLSSLVPAQRVAIARLAATELAAKRPDLPGEWCQLVARLRLVAGDTIGAGELFAEAGRRALAEGATASAITLLDRAYELLADDGSGDAGADVSESLVYALAEAGQLDRAFGLAQTLAQMGERLSGHGRVALYTRLAWGAVLAGRWADAATHLATARALLGPDPPRETKAAADIVEAHLIMEGRGQRDGEGPGRAARAEQLALSAVEVAESHPLPVVACQAWQLLAMLARTRSFEEADACLTRMLAVAQTHGLPIWRVHAMLRLGINQAMRTGDLTGLDLALDSARSIGAIAIAYTAESSIAMEMVLRAEYLVADEITARCVEATTRLKYIDDCRYIRMTRATLAAHQADRTGMERELAEFRRWDGEQSLQMPVVFGLCRAFCALLEEDRTLACIELDRARTCEAANPSVFYLAGRYGLELLLNVLHGDAGEREYADVAAQSGADLRWNRQFLCLAAAVLHARAGREQASIAQLADAEAVAAIYPLARHLGLRLVAEAAITEGWGDPVAWLRRAEEYFHGAGVSAVASACRALLRRSGASAPQRRSGRDLIPAALRCIGLTVREYDVLVLLADRHGNKDIATALFISPRTVEKHVASLMAKTGCADRAGLRDYLARVRLANAS
jgi:DNA-binding CsgD family transcriptional regulator